jgi:hypothetical protein
VILLGFFVRMLTIVTVKHNGRCYLLNIFVLFDLIKIKHGGKPKTPERSKSPKHFFFWTNLSVAKLSKYFCQLKDKLLLLLFLLLLFLVLQQ